MRLILGIPLLAALGLAQPAFEVASIRPSQIGRAGGEGSRRSNIRVSPDGVTMRNVSLKSCIGWAYHVMEYQVNGPDWIGYERFDIVAKASGPAAEDDLRKMFQGLLAERFKVELHRQNKEMAAFVLTVGKNGPKFHETESEGEMNVQPDRNRMTLTVQRAPVSELVSVLSNVLRAPVLDETGLKGRYDITVDLAKYLGDMAGHDGPPPDPLSIIGPGLQQELGLKLESRKTALDLLIIDHAEKVPVEN